MTIGPWDLLIGITVGALFLAVLWALIRLDEWADRRGEAKECTSFDRCPECAAEPPSRLDRWDRGSDPWLP